MAKNETTITLPILSEGRVYVSMATDLAVLLGCGVGPRTFHPADHTDAIRDGTYAYGLRQCGGDGGAKGAGQLTPTRKPVSLQGAMLSMPVPIPMVRAVVARVFLPSSSSYVRTFSWNWWPLARKRSMSSRP